MHGIGGLVLTSFPDLEKQGANLTAEALLRGIAFAAKQRGVTSFRNIYVQLDNTGSNKCGTFIVACALLVALGVCKKIKVNYLEVGHTHDDIDALIGNVVVKLRTMDLPTLDLRIQAILDALNAAHAQIKAVETVSGITDFESDVERLFPYEKGIVDIKEFRISADDKGTPIFLYKSDSTVDGWYPRPFEREDDFEQMAEVFRHPDPGHGNPVKLIEVIPGSSSKSGEKGKRQHWFYKVRFASGAIHTFPMKCIGIPIEFPDDAVNFARNIKLQQLNGPLSSEPKRNQIFENIKKMLTARDGKIYILFTMIRFLR